MNPPDTGTRQRIKPRYQFWPAVVFVLAVIVVQATYGLQELHTDWLRLVHEWTGVTVTERRLTRR
jgi:hypothetical protein